METRLDLKALGEKEKREREKPSGFTLLSDSASKQTLIKFAHLQKHLIIPSQAPFLVGLGARIRDFDFFATESNKDRTKTCKVAAGRAATGCLLAELDLVQLVGKGKHATTFLEHRSCHCMHASLEVNT